MSGSSSTPFATSSLFKRWHSSKVYQDPEGGQQLLLQFCSCSKVQGVRKAQSKQFHGTKHSGSLEAAGGQEQAFHGQPSQAV
jgi:hypothetical protein